MFCSEIAKSVIEKLEAALAKAALHPKLIDSGKLTLENVQDVFAIGLANGLGGKTGTVLLPEELADTGDDTDIYGYPNTGEKHMVAGGVLWQDVDKPWEEHLQIAIGVGMAISTELWPEGVGIVDLNFEGPYEDASGEFWTVLFFSEGEAEEFLDVDLTPPEMRFEIEDFLSP